MKVYMVVNYYAVSFSLKFYEDPCTNTRARGINVRMHEEKKFLTKFFLQIIAILLANISNFIKIRPLVEGISDIPLFVTMYNFENENQYHQIFLISPESNIHWTSVSSELQNTLAPRPDAEFIQHGRNVPQEVLLYISLSNRGRI